MMKLNLRRIDFKLIFFLSLILIFSGKTYANNTLKACAEPWPPFDYREGHTIKGKDVTLNQSVVNQLDLQLKVYIMPWQRCWQLIQAGKMDVALMVSKKKDREAYVDYSSIPSRFLNYVWVIDTHHNPNLTCNQSICSSDKNTKKEPLKLGLIQGNSYSKHFLNCVKENPNQITVKQYPTLSYAFRMLLNDQIQILPTVDEIAHFYIKQIKADHLKVCNTPLFGKDYYTVFAKKSSFSNESYANILSVKNAFDRAFLNIN